MCESMRATTIPSGKSCVEVYRCVTRRSTITTCKKVFLTINNGLFSINSITLAMGIDASTGTTRTADGDVCGGLSSTAGGGEPSSTCTVDGEVCEGLCSTAGGGEPLSKCTVTVDGEVCEGLSSTVDGEVCGGLSSTADGEVCGCIIFTADVASCTCFVVWDSCRYQTKQEDIVNVNYYKQHSLHHRYQVSGF